MARRAAGLGLNLIAYDPYASEEKARAQVSASGFSCRMHRILLDHWCVLLSCVPIWCKALRGCVARHWSVLPYITRTSGLTQT